MTRNQPKWGIAGVRTCDVYSPVRRHSKGKPSSRNGQGVLTRGSDWETNALICLFRSWSEVDHQKYEREYKELQSNEE